MLSKERINELWKRKNTYNMWIHVAPYKQSVIGTSKTLFIYANRFYKEDVIENQYQLYNKPFREGGDLILFDVQKSYAWKNYFTLH